MSIATDMPLTLPRVAILVFADDQSALAPRGIAVVPAAGGGLQLVPPASVDEGLPTWEDAEWQ